MGNDEKDSSDESKVDEENSEDLKNEEENDSTEKKEEKESGTDENKEEKTDVESLRKVIKVDQTEKKEAETEVKQETNKPSDKPKQETNTSSREGLEQKRAILQNIKDFDFQIKKNQEDIGSVHKKLDSMSKDLDDLVSLYEIVSEQMNPFVGLSKVTKKRLDALENFTREIEALKDRTGELESFAERSGAKLQRLGENRQEVKTIDTEALLGADKEENEEKEDDTDENKSETKDKKVETKQENKEKIEDEIKDKTIEEEKNLQEEPEKIEKIPDKNIPSNIEKEQINDFSEEGLFDNISFEESVEAEPIEPIQTNNKVYDEDSFDFDMIIEMALGSLSKEANVKIDMLIDEFIESLKG